jgi:lysyl-tRNA synthetase class 1
MTYNHWADEIADQVQATGRPIVISTGISPSGEIHIGNMREVLTGDAVYRALLERGQRPRFHYVCDNFDPLRRVYPFLDEGIYGPLVGRPLSAIRGPGADGLSYAEHFLRPFLEALGSLHVDVELIRADELYRSGRMNPFMVRALEQRDLIASILKELTGREVAAAWSPFNPWCPACRRIDRARVTGFSAKLETVDYACGCGSAGRVPMAGGGKLAWRIDWPARWVALGVTVEPFGKDHATRGGSYETGVRLVREVFGGEPPLPIPYEWISLEDAGDMAKSKGNTLSIASMLEVVPPEVLRYLVIREKPQRRIVFHPGPRLLQLADELENAETSGRDARAVELSRTAGFQPLGISYRHLAVVAQAARFQAERIVEILQRTGYRGVSPSVIASRLPYIRRWLERFAPDELRFDLKAELPPETSQLSASEREFLVRLAAQLRDGMDGLAIHNLIHDLSRDFPDTPAAELFQAIYVALLGKSRGPRAGWFISLLGPSLVAARLREAGGQGAHRTELRAGA